MGRYSMAKTLDRKAPAPDPRHFEVVELAREHRDAYWPLPWAMVAAAARKGTDGLSVRTVIDNGKGLPPRAGEGRVWLREHQDGSGRTVLYSQG
jgi:hypothetical protein